MTTQLVEQAMQQRDGNLGNLVGDLRMNGIDVTRWEVYAAPFRIELHPDLLDGTWRERAPRVG